MSNEQHVRDVAEALQLLRSKGAPLSTSIGSSYFTDLSHDEKRDTLSAYFKGVDADAENESSVDRAKIYANAAVSGAKKGVVGAITTGAPALAAAIGVLSQNHAAIPNGMNLLASKLYTTPTMAKFVAGTLAAGALSGAISGIISRKQIRDNNLEYEGRLRPLIGDDVTPGSNPRLIANLMYPKKPESPLLNMVKGMITNRVGRGNEYRTDMFLNENLVNP